MKNIRIGLFGARADNCGLGNQTFEFFRHMRPSKTAVIDISAHNGHTNFFERYTSLADKDHKVSIITGFPTPQQINEFLKDLDVVFCCEVPYNYKLFALARKKGVKTILQYNYEFLDYLNTPNLDYPDVFASPSQWHLDDMDQFKDKADVRFLPFPIARDVLPFRKIDKIETFVHVAGHRLFEDRNGTKLVLNALSHIRKTNAKIIIYSQHDLNLRVGAHHIANNQNVKLRNGITLEVRHIDFENYWDLYAEGDCLLLPRRYGGQTLQMNEAMSCGMIPVMLDCDPNNTLLSKELLIPVLPPKKIMTRTAIDCYDTNPRSLAAKIEQLYRLDEERVLELNSRSNEYANVRSWEMLRPMYMDLFNRVLGKK